MSRASTAFLLTCVLSVLCLRASAAPASKPPVTCDEKGWASDGDAHVKVWARCTGRYEAAIAKTLGLMGGYYTKFMNVMGTEPRRDPGQNLYGGDPRIDIYLVAPAYEKGAAKDAALGRSFYKGTGDIVERDGLYVLSAGEASAFQSNSETPAPGRSSGFVLLRRDVIDSSAAGERAQFENAAAHELFHLFQYAYNSKLALAGLWFADASASWAAGYATRGTAAEKATTGGFARFLNPGVPLPLDYPDEGFPYFAFIWPQFVEMERGPQAIGRIWKSLVGVTSLTDALAKMDAEIPFKEAFPRFAVRNLNSAEFASAQERRYQGLDEVAPKSLSRQLDPKGKDDEGLRTKVTDWGPLRSLYIRYKVDNAVGKVVVEAGDFPRAHAAIDVLIKVDGQWQKPRRVEGDKLEICRNRKDERAEEVLLVVSNHSAKGEPVTGQFRVKSPEAACKGWNGTVEITHNFHDGPRQGESVCWVVEDSMNYRVTFRFNDVEDLTKEIPVETTLSETHVAKFTRKQGECETTPACGPATTTTIRGTPARTRASLQYKVIGDGYMLGWLGATWPGTASGTPLYDETGRCKLGSKAVEVGAPPCGTSSLVPLDPKDPNRLKGNTTCQIGEGVHRIEWNLERRE
jgi:hypothetical protein